MTITRRDFILSSAGALGAAALSAPALALADAGPIKIGWLAALTGPSSAPGVGFDRGVHFATDSINAAGGIKGRKIEIVTRDTQGDPTKAVNAVQEMINSEKVHAVWGPTNSGESLAVTAILARARMPDIHPCVIDSLIDPKRFPNAFRLSPSNTQWMDAARDYCLKIQKFRKVAVFADTTGYGAQMTKTCAEDFRKHGAEVVYMANIDATQPDVSPDMIKARNAGAEVIAAWSVSTGLNARLFNARGHMGWKVAFAGHPSLSSGEVKSLIEKPEYWEDVYAVGYRSASYDAEGKLPTHSQEFVDMTRGKVSLDDTLYWWVAGGYDAIQLVAKAIQATGSTQNTSIIGYLNALTDYQGYFGTYTYTPSEHNGYPTSEVVMSTANSARHGTFALAPGYL